MDLTSRISQYLLLTCRCNRRPEKKKWTIQVMRIHMAIRPWTMRICRHRKANTRNRISTMNWIQVVILRRSLPQAALRCRYRAANTMSLIWMRLWILMILAEIHLQEAVHRDRDLDTGHRQMSHRFRWSIMTRLLLQKFPLVLLGRFLTLLIRTRC